MDPDANLQEQLELAREILEADDISIADHAEKEIA